MCNGIVCIPGSYPLSLEVTHESNRRLVRLINAFLQSGKFNLKRFSKFNCSLKFKRISRVIETFEWEGRAAFCQTTSFERCFCFKTILFEIFETKTFLIPITIHTFEFGESLKVAKWRNRLFSLLDSIGDFQKKIHLPNDLVRRSWLISRLFRCSTNLIWRLIWISVVNWKICNFHTFESFKLKQPLCLHCKDSVALFTEKSSSSTVVCRKTIWSFPLPKRLF